MTIMTTTAKGTFEVTLNPAPPYDTAKGATLGRMAVAKTFAGDLVGESSVEMLSAICEVKGSGGYVAIERVSGTLEGRKGTFVLQHSGTRDRGTSTLHVTVVPDSATDELTGLMGQLQIEIREGKHFYTFDYEYRV